MCGVRANLIEAEIDYVPAMDPHRRHITKQQQSPPHTGSDTQQSNVTSLTHYLRAPI